MGENQKLLYRDTFIKPNKKIKQKTVEAFVLNLL